MYKIFVRNTADLAAITAGLVKQGVCFKAKYDDREAAWVIEMTGAF